MKRYQSLLVLSNFACFFLFLQKRFLCECILEQTQLVITCSKITIETLEQGVRYVNNLISKVNNKDTRDNAMASLNAGWEYNIENYQHVSRIFVPQCHGKELCTVNSKMQTPALFYLANDEKN